jgi:hypothetical protein
MESEKRMKRMEDPGWPPVLRYAEPLPGCSDRPETRKSARVSLAPLNWVSAGVIRETLVPTRQLAYPHLDERRCWKADALCRNH